MISTIVDEYYFKLHQIFDKEQVRQIKLSDLVEKYNYKLIDITIILACIVNCEGSDFILDRYYEITKYIESGKEFSFPNVTIERLGVEDG